MDQRSIRCACADKCCIVCGETSAEWVLASQRTMLSHSTVECECWREVLLAKNVRIVLTIERHSCVAPQDIAGPFRPLEFGTTLQNRRTKIGHNCTQTRRVHFTCQFISEECNSMNTLKEQPGCSCMALSNFWVLYSLLALKLPDKANKKRMRC